MDVEILNATRTTGELTSDPSLYVRIPKLVNNDHCGEHRGPRAQGPAGCYITAGTSELIKRSALTNHFFVQAFTSALDATPSALRLTSRFRTPFLWTTVANAYGRSERSKLTCTPRRWRSYGVDLNLTRGDLRSGLEGGGKGVGG